MSLSIAPDSCPDYIPSEFAISNLPEAATNSAEAFMVTVRVQITVLLEQVLRLASVPTVTRRLKAKSSSKYISLGRNIGAVFEILIRRLKFY